MQTRSASLLVKVFVAAAAVRWSYALVLFAFMGDVGLMGFDSYTYVDVAKHFAAALSAGSVQGWDWLGPHTVVMPLYNAILGITELCFGRRGVLAYVLVQGLFDAGTCVLVFLIAERISPAYALPAGIAAILNPTQIVISGLVYPDTPFVFFVALSMLGSLAWLGRPGIGATAAIAAGLAGGVLFRILLLPWLAVLLSLLAIAAWLRARLSLLAAGQLVTVALLVAACVLPILGRNVTKYDAWSLTSQGGDHLFTVVPWIRQAYDGTPWGRGNEQLVAEEKRRFPTPTKNPFEASDRRTQIAEDAWRSYGIVPTAKAWLYGAVINLVSPAVLLSPPIIQIPRTGFYGTPGQTMVDKVVNFLFHSESAIYTWALLTSAAGLLIIRLIQAAGTLSLLRMTCRDATRIPAMAMVALWFAFILAVNGPVGTPKYRLPLEPLLNVLTAGGFCTIRRWRGRTDDIART